MIIRDFKRTLKRNAKAQHKAGAEITYTGVDASRNHEGVYTLNTRTFRSDGRHQLCLLYANIVGHKTEITSEDHVAVFAERFGLNYEQARAVELGFLQGGNGVDLGHEETNAYPEFENVGHEIRVELVKEGVYGK